MSYITAASKIKSNVDNLKTQTTMIKNIDFNSVWSGDAHGKLTANLNEIIAKINTETTNLSNFVTSLNLLDDYKTKNEELKRMKNRLSSIPDDEEHAGERSELSEAISELEKELVNLKSRIIALINFSSNATSFELVSFKPDESTYKDFTYVVDIDNLKSLAENNMLSQLNENETLYDYYSKEEIDSTIESIKSEYIGREAAVNCTLAVMQMAANVGKKLRYGNSRDVYDIAIRSDCSVFASWAINQGTENGDFTKKNVIKLADSGKRYQYYEEAY